MKSTITPGLRFGRWVVLKRDSAKASNGGAVFLCRCDCGTEKIVVGDKLRRGTSQSCGCLRNEMSAERESTHRLTKHRLYPVWQGMMARCTRPHNPAYPDYGGRGIRVCARWGDVRAFIADNEAAATPGTTMDRIDNDGDYDPGNVRWATRQEQSRNRRSNVLLTHDGRTMTLTEWALEIGVKPRTLWKRINDGWGVERALSTPTRTAHLSRATNR